MPHIPSFSQAKDPLSLEAVHESQSRSRSKSQGSMNQNVQEHFSGLLRAGRIVTSIFDRGRHLKYDYHVAAEDAKGPRNDTLAVAYATSASNKTSRASSMASAVDKSSRSPSNVSSRRSSSDSTEHRRERRGGMSVS